MTEAEQAQSLILTREFLPEDEGFIYSTWLKGLYYGNDWFRRIKLDRFYEVYHHVIEKILAAPDTQIQLACFKDRPDVLVAYSVSQGSRLHWIYCKTSWRRLGIARKLLPAGVRTCTHLTKLGSALMPKDWDFDPFL